MTTVAPNTYGIYVVPVTSADSPIMIQYAEVGMPIHKDYMRDKHGRTQVSKHLIAVMPVSGELPEGARRYIIRQSNHPPDNRCHDIMIPLGDVGPEHVKLVQKYVQQLRDLSIISALPRIVSTQAMIKLIWPDMMPIEECINTRIVLDGMKWESGQLIRAIWAHKWTVGTP